MTALLWASLTLTATVALAALALALAAAGRLREVQDRLDRLTAGHDADRGLPRPGEPVPDFAAPTTAGELVGSADLTGADTLVLFVTTDCDSCRELVDRLTRPGAALPAGAGRPVAVLVGPPAERAELVPRLAAVARVVEEDDHGGLAARFAVRSFPAVLLVGGGQVRAAANELDEVLAGVPA